MISICVFLKRISKPITDLMLNKILFLFWYQKLSLDMLLSQNQKIHFFQKLSEFLKNFETHCWKKKSFFTFCYVFAYFLFCFLLLSKSSTVIIQNLMWPFLPNDCSMPTVPAVLQLPALRSMALGIITTNAVWFWNINNLWKFLG